VPRRPPEGLSVRGIERLVDAAALLRGD
jgi:hypothetical protein